MRCPNCGYQTYGGDQLSTGGWFVRILISFIPVIGFIALLVWALGSPSCRSLKTWARAQLLFYIIPAIVVMILVATGSVSIHSIFK